MYASFLSSQHIAETSRQREVKIDRRIPYHSCFVGALLVDFLLDEDISSSGHLTGSRRTMVNPVHILITDHPAP